MRSARHICLCLVLMMLGSVALCHGAAVPRVGVVFSSDTAYYRQVYSQLRAELERLGYTASRLELFVQKPHADLYSLANSARRAQASGVSALVTLGTPATRVALQETRRVPIVFSAAFSPLEATIEPLQKLSPSDLQDVGGIYNRVPLATLIQAFAGIRSGATLLAVFHHNDLDAPYLRDQLAQAASIYGLTLETRTLDDRRFVSDLEPFSPEWGGPFLSQGTFGDPRLAALLETANRLKLPVIGCDSVPRARTLLLNLSAGVGEQGLVAARQLVAFLEKGSGVLQKVSPHAVDFTVDMESARLLGVRVPFQVLTSATRIITSADN